MLALIVEDDPSWQGILAEILSDHGLKVDVANHLLEAINKLRSTPYRLAIVDLSLEGEDHHNRDGLQVLMAIKRYVPGCISILLTGFANVELAVAAIQEYGAFTCLRKETFRRAEFRQVVHQALATPTEVVSKIEPGGSSSLLKPQDEDETTKEAFLRLALVVEDDAGWRSLLTELLNDAGYRVRDSASYGEALGQLKREQYQLALVDLSLANSQQTGENQDGFRLLRYIQEAEIPTIIVSGSADLDLIDRAYAEHQVFACLEKQSFERSAFLETVQQIAECNALSRDLTGRELEVLALVAQGLGNKEIAAELVITTNTVKRHLKSIFAKLEVNSRAAASAYAIRMGLGGSRR
jgi:DNA-binding NarL/FixJ family response regulator